MADSTVTYLNSESIYNASDLMKALKHMLKYESYPELILLEGINRVHLVRETLTDGSNVKNLVFNQVSG